ncbi:hypothetical protein ACT6QH_13410 [Xanthobacter sp. TB0139]|uniref:hypothetical protein n=1 Tax=Xanthobacter sp. TB0139 TaxID=3459178 RepID=UPI00403972D4
MLKQLFVAATLALSTSGFSIAPLSTPALAAEAAATAPVQAIMDVATRKWADTGHDAPDYFDAAHIGNFSTRLRKLYAEASKHPVFEPDEETGNPFDYDPILSRQDGCPLKDVTITETGKTGAVTNIVARFKGSTCFDGASPEDRNIITEIQFRVITEDGKPVIDDVTTGEGDEKYTLSEDLKAIISH